MTQRTETTMSLLRRFVADTSGSTAVEYTLIASAICIAIAGIVDAMGQKLVIMMTSVSNIFN
jgi:Flp pilus assembly pilin Flp